MTMHTGIKRPKRRIPVEAHSQRWTGWGPAQSQIANGLAALATSSTLVAGYAFAQILNNDGAVDKMISGSIRVGTTPTANTLIEIWLVPKLTDNQWPDVFTGAPNSYTVSSRPQFTNYAGLVGSLAVDSNTTGRDYPFARMACEALGTRYLPKAMQIFVTHSTAVNLDATAGGLIKHIVAVTPYYEAQRALSVSNVLF